MITFCAPFAHGLFTTSTGDPAPIGAVILACVLICCVIAIIEMMIVICIFDGDDDKFSWGVLSNICSKERFLHSPKLLATIESKLKEYTKTEKYLNNFYAWDWRFLGVINICSFNDFSFIVLFGKSFILVRRSVMDRYEMTMMASRIVNSLRDQHITDDPQYVKMKSKSRKFTDEFSSYW
jgi:hypothetical protein